MLTKYERAQQHAERITTHYDHLIRQDVHPYNARFHTAFRFGVSMAEVERLVNSRGGFSGDTIWGGASTPDMATPT